MHSWSSRRATPHGRWFGVFGAVLIVALVTQGFVASPAYAATLTVAVSRQSSGTTVDAASTCQTQGVAGPTDHCPGYDTSAAASDQILRSGDSASVTINFGANAADTAVTIRSTLPREGTDAAATWSAIPAACATGSSLADSNRTLVCRIANPTGPASGSLQATLSIRRGAADALDVRTTTTIQSASSQAVPATAEALFTVSNAPFYDLVKNNGSWANTLPAPFFYRGPGGEPGFAVPSSTVIATSRVGGTGRLQTPVTWQETAPSRAGAPAGIRLLNWGDYGSGCGLGSSASRSPNAGFENRNVSISNQISAGTGQYACTQPGGAGGRVDISLTGLTATPGSPMSTVWTMLWVPSSSLPIGNSTIQLSADGFAPVGLGGAQNYLGGSEPTANNLRTSGTISNQDNRELSKATIADIANPASTPRGTAVSTVNRRATFQSALSFRNSGTVPQAAVRVCDAFDSTVTRLTAFPSDAFAVLTTRGARSGSLQTQPYRPADEYDNATNFAVDPAAYTVEFAAGDFSTTAPATAPQPLGDMQASRCTDAGGATGWVSDPNDPAIVAYANSLGLSDPFDVINRVRVTLDSTLESSSEVNVKLRFTANATYRDATTRAGSTILATTALSDVATAVYSGLNPAVLLSASAQPRITGSSGVRVSTAQPTLSATNLQAGSESLDTAVYRFVPRLSVGEDVLPEQPVRSSVLIPPGLRYVGGSANVAPAHELQQPDGSMLLVWDFGVVTGTPNQTVALPAITFSFRADPFGPTPASLNISAATESRAPDGTANDTRAAVDSRCTAALPISVPATESVLVPTTVDMARPAGLGAFCREQGWLNRSEFATVRVGNAFQVSAGMTALRPRIQANDADGDGGLGVGYTLRYRNLATAPVEGFDVIQLMPVTGDASGSTFSGRVALSSIAADDQTSPTPNALPTSATAPFPPREGSTIYVTSDPSASLDPDPYAPRNLDGGATGWCVLAQVGDAGCPAVLAEVTAIRVISGALAPSGERTVRVGLATAGNAIGDRYASTARARAIGISSLINVASDTFTVVASSVAGVIWDDANGDGVIQSTEKLLEGVKIRAAGAADDGSTVTREQTTGADGRYTFSGLRAGDYSFTVDDSSVRAISPAYAVTFDPTRQLVEPAGDFALKVPFGTDVRRQNVGYATQSLAGTVFIDLDDNGAQEAGERGESGVTLRLDGTDDDGTVLSLTAVTDRDGAYRFADLRPGTYTITKVQPAATVPGKITPGSLGGTASGPRENTISGITVPAAGDGVGYRFADLESNIISGTVYDDASGDGTLGSDELGIGGAPVTLDGTDDLGTAVSLTAATRDDGTFTFTSLRRGTYRVVVSQPGGYLGGATALNGAVGDASQNTIENIVVSRTNVTSGYLFGQVKPAELTGLVYDDVNADGIRQATEAGVSGGTVTLTGADDRGDDVSLTASVDPEGEIAFFQLRPGRYTLTHTAPDGYFEGREQAGTAGGVVDDQDPASTTISEIEIVPGAAASDYLFGVLAPASLAGSVYVDSDANGVRDAGELGLPGTVLTLTGTDMFDRVVSRELVAGENGEYLAEELHPGMYSIAETQPAGYADGAITVGSAGGTPGANLISDIPLGSGTVATGYLFGEIGALALSGVVFSDGDGDDQQEAGEDGIPDAVLELLDVTGAPTGVTARTDERGAYSFTGLLPGTYGVQIAPPTGFFPGRPIPGTAGGTAGENRISDIVLSADASGYDFSAYAPSVISGTVWQDANDNGRQDEGEAGIPNVTISLDGPTSKVATTSAEGRFLFSDLPSGEYSLVQTQPDGYANGRSVIGAAGGAASAENTITGITIGASAFADGYGFGERVPRLQLTGAVQTLPSPTAPGPSVRVGDPVRWTYTATNNGETALDELEITDDAGAVLVCETETLAAGATTTCESDTVAREGQQRSAVTASAAVVPSDPGPQPQARAVETVTAVAEAHYFGLVTAVSLSVRVNGDRADTPGEVTVPDGTEVTVEALITNDGNAPLSPRLVTAGEHGPLTCDPSGPIAPGDTVVCSMTWVPPAASYAVEVHAELVGPEVTAADGTVSATDVAADARGFYAVSEPEPEPDPDPDSDTPTPPGAGGDTDPGGVLGTTGGDHRGLVALTAALLLGGMLLFTIRRRRPEDQPTA